MSKSEALTELADFAAEVELRGKEREEYWRAYFASAEHKKLRGRPVTDLLGVVMALSSRTRRVLAPRVQVELDVFSPEGKRAVRLSVGSPDQD